MTAFIVSLVVIAALAAAAVFAVAYRQRAGDDATPTVQGRLSRRTLRKDRPTAAPVAATEPQSGIHEPDEPLPDPLTEREEITPEQYDMTRRSFLATAAAAVFGLFLVQFGISALAYMWPKLRGGFGTKIRAGKIDDIKQQLVQSDGSITPLFVSSAQAWIVPFEESTDGSSFEGLPVVADGLMALWQRCVHLGCRVPECNSSQGFECPCHGSKYNYHGEYEDGPAPRNMDRFAVEVDGDQLIIDTGAIIQTARSARKTAIYPQGPSCITGGGE